jgi:hypothetical protein
MTKKQAQTKGSKTVAATASKGKKAPTPEVKPAKKATAAVDSFGSRIGSLNAKVNAMLSKTEPVTMADITKKLGCPTKYNHINSMIEKKLVVKTDKGYVLA